MSHEMIDSGVEWIGDIPKGWETVRFKDKFMETTKKGFPKHQLLAATQHAGVIPKADLEWRTVEAKEDGREAFKLVIPDNFVISLRSFEGGIEHSNVEGIISPAYTVLSVKKNRNIQPCFFRWLFKSHGFIAGLQKHQKGIREGQAIAFSTLKSDMLPLPPLAEQKAIAEFLDRETGLIDKRLSLIDRKRGLLRELRRSVVHEAVTKGLDRDVEMVDSGVEWIGEIPKGWSVSRIKNASITLGKMLCPEPKGKAQISAKYLRSANVSAGVIEVENVKEMWFSSDEIKELTISNGDILIVEGGKIGFPMLVKGLEDEVFCFQNSVNRIRSKWNQSFLYFWMQWLYDSGYHEQINSVSIAHLTKEMLGLCPIAIPNMAEQRAIADFLDRETGRIDRMLSILDRQEVLLKEQRKALVHEVVTGKRRVA